MRLPLEARESECLIPIFSDKLTGEASGESVIPDTCSDAGKILDVRGQSLLTGKTISGDEVKLYGEIHAQVIVQAEESEEVFCVSVKLPYELEARRDELNEDCLLTVEAEMPRLEARLINPRKLLVRAKLAAFVCCWKKDKLTLWEAPGDEDPRVCLLKKETVCCYIADAPEKTFSLSDEYVLPFGEGEGKVLSCETEILVSDVKTVGTKLLFKVTGLTRVVLMDGEGRLDCRCFETQFSQMIDSPWAGDDQQVYITPYLSAAEHTVLKDRDEAVLAISLRICVQAVCVARKRCGYIADAYSNIYPIKIEKESFEAVDLEPPRQRRIKLEGTPEMQGCKVLYLVCDGASHRIEDGKDLFPARVRGIGLDPKGELIPLEFTVRGYGEPVDPELDIKWVRAMKCGTPYTEPNGSVVLELNYEELGGKRQALEIICGLETDEEEYRDRENSASFTILWTPGGSLWELAKEYGSTVSAITSANSLKGEFDPQKRPILIPKA